MRGQTPRTTELCNLTEEDVDPLPGFKSRLPATEFHLREKSQEARMLLGIAGDQCDIFPNQKILQDVYGSVVRRYSNWVKEPHVRRNRMFYGSVDAQRGKLKLCQKQSVLDLCRPGTSQAVSQVTSC